MANRIKAGWDLTNLRFGRLLVLRPKDPSLRFIWNSRWICDCDCGTTEKEVGANSLIRKTKPTRSCGCLIIDVRKTHGETNKTKEYTAWAAMLSRCYNSKTKYWYNYGGRGITVCDRWRESYVHFLADMGRAPSSLHSLDRIYTNGNYQKDNCQWSSGSIQRYTRRLQKSNKSGVVGVFYRSRDNVYVATIGYGGKRVFYRQFQTMEEAIAARKEAELKYFGFHPDENLTK